MIFRVQRVAMGVALAIASSHSAIANDIRCKQIADETVTEMKAGANDWWSGISPEWRVYGVRLL